ncbi:MAG: Xaa-Pro peptidase family protein [Dehalococcoidia bacterium]|nr:Xaa-Pro peptidase family protein [Dehalococcoidia bacterium]
METIPARLKKLRTALSEKGIPAILISQSQNRRYLSGFSGSAGYLLITSSGQKLATDFRYVEQARQQAPHYGLFEIRGSLSNWFANFIVGLESDELYFESEEVSFDRYTQFKNILTPLGIELKPCAGLVEALRAIKESGEIALIERAVGISDAAIEHIRETAKPGMTELEIAWKIESYMREHGSEAVPFEVIVAAGLASALPHHSPSEREIETGEPVVIDIGARCSGYASDLTRTICFGKETAEFRRIYDVVLRAQLAAIDGIRAGMTGEEADAIARHAIAQTGYDNSFGHGLGHGIGLRIHESPRLGTLSKDILSDGMVFSIEPGIYIPDWGGVRIEDTAVLENGKIRVLSTARK